MSVMASLVGKALGLVFGNTSSAPVSAARVSNQQAWAQSPGSVRAAVRQVRIERIVDETADTRSLWLSTEDGTSLAFQAGQFLTCCFQIDGQEVRRAYSLSTVPGSQTLRITVKRLDEGRVSGFIHQQLQVGDTFGIRGPSGDFVLPPELTSAVFLAGGSGITPIRSQIEALLSQRPGLSVQLIYASRNRQHIIFRDELEALAADHPELTIAHLLTRPDAKRLSKLLADEGGTDAGRYYFLCGPDGFMQLVQSTLQALAIAPTQIRSERFLAAASARQPHPTMAQTIRFLQAGKSVVAQPGQTLLEAGLAAGIPLAYSCQVGGCGHCRVKISEGEVVSDEPNCLSEDERNQGYRLACLSYACSAVAVEA